MDAGRHSPRRVLVYSIPGGHLTNLPIAIEIAPEILFERFEQRKLHLLHFAKLRLQPSHSLFQRLGGGSLIRNLTLLDQIPEKAHGCLAAWVCILEGIVPDLSAYQKSLGFQRQRRSS